MMTAPQARIFWKALMDNASRLIEDAHTLLGAGSAGRAKSLVVLAQEELGKALWVYDEFSSAWSVGDDEERTVDRLAKDGNSHVQKYLEALVYCDRLSGFWGDYSGYALLPDETWEQATERFAVEAETRRAEAREAGRAANTNKQRGVLR